MSLVLTILNTLPSPSPPPLSSLPCTHSPFTSCPQMQQPDLQYQINSQNTETHRHEMSCPRSTMQVVRESGLNPDQIFCSWIKKERKKEGRKEGRGRKSVLCLDTHRTMLFQVREASAGYLENTSKFPMLFLHSLCIGLGPWGVKTSLIHHPPVNCYDKEKYQPTVEVIFSLSLKKNESIFMRQLGERHYRHNTFSW